MKIQTVSLGICILMVSSVFVGSVGAVDWWPMMGHDPAHTGSTSSSTAETNATIFTIQDSYILRGGEISGIIIDNGKVFMISHNNDLACVDAGSGHQVFSTIHLSDYSFSEGKAIPVSNGTHIFVGGCGESGAYLNCYNTSTGQLQWSQKIISSWPVKSALTLYNEKIYAVTWDGKVVCLDTDGNWLWNYTIIEKNYYCLSSPTVANDRVYLAVYSTGSGMSFISCLNATGNPEDHTTSFYWKTPVSEMPTNMISVDEGGYIYTGVHSSTYNATICLYPNNGTVKWAYPLTGAPTDTVVHNGKVYFCSKNSPFRLYCLDSTTGAYQWNYTIVQPILSISKPAFADNKVYFGDADEYNSTIHCINANTGVLIWQYNLKLSLSSWGLPFTFAIADRIVYAGYKRALVAFRDNTPPDIPAVPTGPSSEATEKDVLYTFYVTPTTDSDGDQIFYNFSWGDDTYSDWIGPVDSGATLSATHMWTLPGSYDIKVKAKDIYDAESEWSHPLEITIPNQSSEPAQLQLSITVNPTVQEQTIFTVTITDEKTGTAQPGADVSFNDQTKQTDANGQVSFTAPSVDTAQRYMITATKTGYTQDSTTITVINQDETTLQGWIYGLVQDNLGNPLSGVSIYAISTDGTIKPTSTDDEGKYVVSLVPGTYTVTGIIEGFLPNTKQSFFVEDKTAKEANFIMEQKQQEPTSQGTDTTAASVQYLIDKESREGNVGAQINVISQEKNIISSYIEGLHIELLDLTEQMISFTVGADDGSKGTVFVVRIGEGVLSDLDKINLTYDDMSIDEEHDVAAFFTILESSDPAWLRILTDTGLYVFVRIPHFSTHTITISSLGEMFGSVTVLLWYLMSSGLVIFVFVVAVAANVVRRQRYINKRK
ncbi:MAG: PQQ-binding-like beta-propeller repeat protein [Euryarchaeota archaeon]|nr:PQQ-binding-like beta-propeller repeat protein [Euryarchaeota archaeon]